MQCWVKLQNEKILGYDGGPGEYFWWKNRRSKIWHYCPFKGYSSQLKKNYEIHLHNFTEDVDWNYSPSPKKTWMMCRHQIRAMNLCAFTKDLLGCKSLNRFYRTYWLILGTKLSTYLNMQNEIVQIHWVGKTKLHNFWIY